MRIFREARENAPSVIFIDDSDVIWERGGGMGLYRYLLTMLDGVENESAGLVCVMLTAMDVGKLPPALIRSGRIELWLEMPLPDVQARRDILTQRLNNLPEPLKRVDMDALITATEGFTGADLLRVVDDAKNLYAYDRGSTDSSEPSTEYYLKAIETVHQNQRRRAEAEARSKSQDETPDYSDYYDYDDDDGGKNSPPAL